MPSCSRPQFLPACKESLDYTYRLCTGNETNHFSSKLEEKRIYRYTNVSKYLTEELSKGGVKMLEMWRFNDVYDSTRSYAENGEWYIQCDIGKKTLGRCFIENKNSLQMWGLYANGSKGICIEYDPEEYSHYFYKVKYEDKPVNLGPAMEEASWQIGSSVRILPILCKSTEWSYEHEWRLINNDNIRWVPLPITTIYFGCKFGFEGKKSEDYLTLRQYVLEKNIPCYVAKLRANKYELSFDEIPIQYLISEDGTPIYSVENDRGEMDSRH